MNDTFDILSELLGVTGVVSFREFVSSPEYCNDPELYEFWYSQEERLPDPLNELILTGSLGGGKTVSTKSPIATDKGYLDYYRFKDNCNLKYIETDNEGTDIFEVSGISAEQTDGSYRPVSRLFYNPRWKLNY